MALAKNNIIINTDVAAASHNHSASQITSGTLPLTRGGTGQTSINGLKSALGINGTLGNCRIQSGTINFRSTSNTLTCGFPPQIVFLQFSSNSAANIQSVYFIRGMKYINFYDFNTGTNNISGITYTLDWNGNSVYISGTGLVDQSWNYVALG